MKTFTLFVLAVISLEMLLLQYTLGTVLLQQEHIKEFLAEDIAIQREIRDLLKP